MGSLSGSGRVSAGLYITFFSREREASHFDCFSLGACVL